MFSGEKVKLREYAKEDLETARSFLNEVDVRGQMWPGILFPIRKEDELKWYDSFSSMSDGPYNFAIETIEDASYIGGCGINSVDPKNRIGTIGIFLGKDYLDNGYGTDALRLLVRFCFDEMNLNKVKLSVLASNTRAIRCYEKIGFHREGVLKEEIYRNGQYHDDLMMAILKAEWMSDGSHKSDDV